MVTDPIVRDPDVQRVTWFLGALANVRAGAGDTAGQWSLIEQVGRRGYSAPLHVHTREEETFLIIDGTVRVVCGDENYSVSAGGLAILPRGRPHAFVVTSSTARIIVLITPAGLEDFFVEAGTPPSSPGLPPESSGPPDVAALSAMAARYGVEIVGPPPEA